MMHQDRNDFILRLSLIPGIGPATIATLIKNKPAHVSWQEICSYDSAMLQSVIGISASFAQRIVQGLADTVSYKKEKQLALDHNIDIITCFDQSYPQALRSVYVPPAVLYVQGTLLETDACIAVIGSRAADTYAKNVMMQLLPPLIEHQWIIVSGGALGADSMAHRIALECGGITYAVLGSGLLKPYPEQNKTLFNEIIARNGCLISPFPLTMQALPGNFPARNRIIAGLSKGCVVVQAAEKSGTRITAQYALEQGAEVFAVPGAIDDPLSAGCHALIQQGAHLVHTAQDILNVIGKPVAALPAQSLSSPKKSRPVVENVLDGNVQLSDPIVLIKQLCSKPCSIDELMHHTQKPLEEIHTLLLHMQLEGIIHQNFAGMWQKNI